MLIREVIAKAASDVKAKHTSMKARTEAVKGKVVAIQADKMRSPAAVQAARDEVLPGLEKDLDFIKKIAAAIEGQRQFWESRSLLMSLQTFSDNAADDAVIRANLRDELARLPLPVLSLVMKDAIVDGNLSRVWQSQLAGRAAAAGELPDWSHIKIPGQTEVLEMLREIAAAPGNAELLVAAAKGEKVHPVRRLEIGHMAVAGQPTSRTSSGRTLPA